MHEVQHRAQVLVACGAVRNKHRLTRGVIYFQKEVISMPKTQTKSHKPTGTAPKNSNGKAASAKKIPLYKTLPPETDPEMLQAYQILVEAAADLRASHQAQNEAEE